MYSVRLQSYVYIFKGKWASFFNVMWNDSTRSRESHLNERTGDLVVCFFYLGWSLCTCSITTIMRLCRQAARFTRPLNTFKPIMREYSSPSRIATLSLASIQTFKIWVYAEFWLACLRTLTSKTSSQASRPLVFGLQTWPG